MDVYDYLDLIESQAIKINEIAKKARNKGLDPTGNTEVPFAKDLASRVEELIGPKGVGQKIRDLDKAGYSREELALLISKDIVNHKFGVFSDKESAEKAIRTSLAILTEGIVSAPLEGICKVDIKENDDGTQYIAIYFAGPIRSAGGTAQALAVLIGDYIRKTMYLDKYKPKKDEIERYVEEVDLYNKKLRLQYLPSSDEVRFAVSNIPVEVTGEPTLEVEVSGFRDLKRVETNRVRGGAILAIAEGVLQKRMKIMKYVSKFDISGWDWLGEIHAKDEKEESDKEKIQDLVKPNPKYMKDVIAGRPVISYPSSKWGFRLVYGRSRATGFATAGVNPATMYLTDEFMALGTQMKIERPGKAACVTPCDTIEGPLARLKNGDVIRINDLELAKKLKSEIDEIIYLGDVLFNYGDFLENNHVLFPSPYIEDWWQKELAQKGLSIAKIDQFSAVDLSKKHDMPLHPKYTFYWNNLSFDDLKRLLIYLQEAKLKFKDNRLSSIEIPLDNRKSIIEDLGIEHKVLDNKIIIKENSYPLLSSLGILDEDKIDISPYDDIKNDKNILELISKISGIKIKNICPHTIGMRMGRPEASKPRLMKPAPHGLFPVGQSGGKTRSFIKAQNNNTIDVQVAELECENCGEITYLSKCPTCVRKTKLVYSCPKHKKKDCDCQNKQISLSIQSIPLKELLKDAEARIGLLPKEIKGVKGMTSAYKIPEAFMKAVLRAKNGVYVFKDGTIRYDGINIPLTHFKPKEISVSVDKLKEIGYNLDIDGLELENDGQVLELLPQDIIVSEDCAGYMAKVCQFIDDLFEYFYRLPRFYNVETKEDLIGHLAVGLAPHTSAGILCRIIGYNKSQTLIAHPYCHAARRRNCDGDGDSIMLLMDVLLNFSKRYLPQKRGGQMDAPLVLTTKLNPFEVDDEVHNMDIVSEYPLEFYELTEKYPTPDMAAKLIEKVSDRLGKKNQYNQFHYTHGISDFTKAPLRTAYKTLKVMEEKVDAQLNVAKRIRAVDADNVVDKILQTHFLPDLIGNLRKFATQGLRCPDCGMKYRRIPLGGKCFKCRGRIILTVHEGGIRKYLDLSLKLAETYNIMSYTKNRVKLLYNEIKEFFTPQKNKQTSLMDFLIPQKT